MNKIPILYMMIGLSGSGKSVVANNIDDSVVLSSDEIRKELFNDVNYQGDNNKVFNLLHKRLKENLGKGNNVVYDATNLSYKRRRHLLQQHLKNVDFKSIACVIATTPTECIKRDSRRQRSVGRDVIMKQLKTFQFPLYQEGFDDIKVVYTTLNYYFNTKFLRPFSYFDEYDQENKNHELTLGGHLNKTADYLYKLYPDKEYLAIAGQLHDVGKPIVKTFKNKKGEIDEGAHYYNHQNVSAYLSMFYAPFFFRELDNEDYFKVFQLISWHMNLYFVEKEKTKQKYLKFLGKEFYDDLVKLHKADKCAH